MNTAMTSAWDGSLLDVTVEPAVHALRPDYVAVVMVARGLVPGDPTPATEAALIEAERSTIDLLNGREAHELDPIAQWRSALAAFGVKPRDARSSVEALMRRAATGLPRIDRLTDTYNAVSVLHQIPVGGEELCGYVGPPRLAVASGDETFDTVANGEPVMQTPEAGEVIWRDDRGVTCRRWNWRQCVRTRLTTQTTDALFIFDGLGADAQVRAEGAAADLRQRLLEFSPQAQFTQRTLLSA